MSETPAKLEIQVPKSILIVEDEIFVAMDIERILAGAGYNVTAIAADRESALDLVDGAEIAFVDVNLRDGRTGPSIACELARSGVKVFYVTGNPAQIDPVAETAIGFIRKPFSDDAIRTAAAMADADETALSPRHREITLFDRVG